MKIAMFLMIFFYGYLSAAGVKSHQVNSLNELKNKLFPVSVENLPKAVKSNSEILYVFDFDNTLMTMQQELGSDQWYNWQTELMQKNEKKYSVAKSKSELFEIQYKLFALGKMRAVEKETVDIVKSLQNFGYKVIILTSRGSEYRIDTEKELSSINLSFQDSAIGPKGGFIEPYLPNNLENPRIVTFQNGILMGSGQEKGILLKDLFARTGYEPKLIIFIDDTPKNISNVAKEFNESEIQVEVVQYDAELNNVRKFEKDKSKAIQHWKLLKPVLEYYNKVEK